MDDLNAPATKGDLLQLRSEMNQQYDQLRGEMNHQYDDLKETIRDSETRLLQAFYGYTQTTDAKL